jgi:polyisoprenoid-binding protein YceI
MSLRNSLSRHARFAASVVALSLVSGAPTADARGEWTIDPARTHILFSIDAVGYPRTEGEFHKFGGRIVVDFDHWEKSSIVFEVESKSVDVGSASFNDYVRSDAFLDAAHFPSIRFVSDRVERIDDHELRVSGEVTLIGVARPLSVIVTARRDGAKARLGFEARTTIDRLEFGMNAGFPLVSKDVELVISTEAAQL